MVLDIFHFPNGDSYEGEFLLGFKIIILCVFFISWNDMSREISWEREV